MAQSREAIRVINVKFIPKAINNYNYIGGNCYDAKVYCLSGQLHNVILPGITDIHGTDKWVYVKTSSGTVKVLMMNLYVSFGSYCTVNFDSYLAGDGCRPRRPQGPPATPAPPIDP